MEVGQHGHATELAERYGDFRVLVQLCDGAGDMEKIRDYMHTYKAQVSHTPRYMKSHLQGTGEQRYNEVFERP